MEELMKLPEEERLKKERGVLKNSFGRGHGSVGDQVHFTFSIEDLPRVVTFELCLPEYLEHLQQSLRRAKASRGFYLPEVIKNSALGKKTEVLMLKSFELYEKMVEKGIPGEDARFLLPLYTKTNITTTGNARELCHMWQMSQRKGVPSIVRAVVDEMISLAKGKAPYLFEDYGFNYETLAWYPSAQLYSLRNPLINDLLKSFKGDKRVTLIGHNANFLRWGISIEKAVKERDETELANLKHVHFEFFISLSLVCLHQAIRQRTWNHTLESIYDAVKSAKREKQTRIIIPPSIKKSEFNSAFQKQHQTMLNLYCELVKGGISQEEAIGVMPHSLKIHTLIHVNGWNAINSIGKRTCLTAQWEIRAIARKMAKIIKGVYPELGKFAEPQCITLGECPEVEDCYYKKKRRS
jgi:thymidylate synthase (FAD)